MMGRLYKRRFEVTPLVNAGVWWLVWGLSVPDCARSPFQPMFQLIWPTTQPPRKSTYRTPYFACVRWPTRRQARRPCRSRSRSRCAGRSATVHQVRRRLRTPALPSRPLPHAAAAATRTGRARLPCESRAQPPGSRLSPSAHVACGAGRARSPLTWPVHPPKLLYRSGVDRAIAASLVRCRRSCRRRRSARAIRGRRHRLGDGGRSAASARRAARRAVHGHRALAARCAR